MKTFAIHSLGCRVNHTEADSFRVLLIQAGYHEVSFGQAADINVVHTCTVTHSAEAKSRQAIHKARRLNDDSLIVVSGCYAQMSSNELKNNTEVDVIIGTDDRKSLLELIEKEKKSKTMISSVHDLSRVHEFEELPFPQTKRTRAFIKIQEGCDQFCSYCIIPYARGPVRSRKLSHILQEVASNVKAGYREVVYTGINLGAYGRDLEGVNLATLITETLNTGIERIRLGSLDPKSFDDQLLEVVSVGPPVMNHFHISLQSGDRDVLEKMRRGYTPDEFLNTLKELRKRIPDVSFTTDLMVGFPQESQLAHERSLAFVRGAGFSDIHVFKYSPREGTKAAKMSGQIDEIEKDRRLKEALALKKLLKKEDMNQQIGEKAKILVEKIRIKNGIKNFWGHSEGFRSVRVSHPLDGPFRGVSRNDMVSVIIKGIDGQQLVAEIDQES